ncbi:MAG: hypothetical protein ACREDC_04170 [Bradyrhizobium sp.]
MQRDGDGRLFKGSQFCLNAQSLFLQYGDPLLGVILRNHVFDHEINIALSLAFDPVTFRLEPHAHCDFLGKIVSGAKLARSICSRNLDSALMVTCPWFCRCRSTAEIIFPPLRNGRAGAGDIIMTPAGRHRRHRRGRQVGVRHRRRGHADGDDQAAAE